MFILESGVRPGFQDVLVEELEKKVPVKKATTKTKADYDNTRFDLTNQSYLEKAEKKKKEKVAATLKKNEAKQKKMFEEYQKIYAPSAKDQAEAGTSGEGHKAAKPTKQKPKGKKSTAAAITTTPSTSVSTAASTETTTPLTRSGRVSKAAKKFSPT